MGGAELQLVRLARRLPEFGIHPEVAIFHLGEDDGVEESLLQAGIPVHHVKRTSKIGLEAIFDMVGILSRGQHQVVHAFLWPANWRARVAGILVPWIFDY